jgi:hypothetical protein
MNPPITRLLMSSSVTVDTSHGEIGAGLYPPLLLFELIPSSLSELIDMVFLARFFLGTITMICRGEI